MDTIKPIIDVIVNNGIGVACVIYMIYFQLTTMKEMSVTLNKMNTSLELLNDRMENLEKKGCKMEKVTKSKKEE